MNCVDCGSPAVMEQRCSDCLEEVAETPGWRGPPLRPTPIRASRVPATTDRVRVCPTCRTQFPLLKARGRARTYCSTECQQHRPNKRPACARPCRRCGRSYVSKLGGARYCPSCAPAPRIHNTQPCEHCRKPIESKHRRQRFCSLSCSGLAQVRVRRACGEPGCDAQSRRKGLCKKHARKRFPCASDLAHARKRNQMKNHLRRGRIRKPESEMIDRDLVGERDGWKCGICHRKVDRARVYPHPRSPSLDHVIPQSEGGPHTYANVRISHLFCNISRSNRGGGEQLVLIG